MAAAVGGSFLNRVGLRAPAHLTGCGKAALTLLPSEEAAARVETVCAAEPGHRPPLRPHPRPVVAATATIGRRLAVGPTG